MPSIPTNLENRRETLEQACNWLRARLGAGQECRTEELLIEFPDLAADELCAMRLVCTEFAVRQELGQRPDPADWYERFPRWRRFLEEHLNSGITVDATPCVEAVTLSEERQGGAAVQPRRLGRYEVYEEVGHGGMGVVYRAQDTVLDRVVALKTIRAGVLATANEVERFSREARAAAQLDHPHIVRILDVGEQDGQNYFTMTFIVGGSLAQQRESFSKPRAAAALVEKLARAAHFAHDKGIIHRDLKPGNVLLDEFGEPQINDFGLAKFIHADADLLTKSGQVLGTPAYMAPEQAAGQIDDVGPRSDVWSLGVILYELLTGKRPFVGREGKDVKQLILTIDPVRPRCLRPGLARDLETIVLKCLEKNPARRYATAEELADDLHRWLCDEPIRARPQGWVRCGWRAIRRHPTVSTVAVMIAAVALIAWNFWPDGQHAPSLPDLPAEPMELLSEAGFAKPYRWPLGEAELVAPMDGVIRMSTDKLRLLELLDRVPFPHYRLEAEVQDAMSGTAEVGIYVGHPAARAAQEHWFCSLTFSERPADVAKKKGQAVLLLQGYREEPVWQHTLPINANAAKTFPVARGQWRKLAIEVTADQVRAYWNEQDPDFTHGSRAKLARQFQLAVKGSELRTKNAPAVDFDAGIGLICRSGSGCFQRVKITPLP